MGSRFNLNHGLSIDEWDPLFHENCASNRIGTLIRANIRKKEDANLLARGTAVLTLSCAQKIAAI